MSERADAQRQLDGACADIAKAHLGLGQLCVFIRTSGDTNVRCIAPDVDAGTIAKMLYRAADTYASHSIDRLSPEQIVRLRD